MKVNSYNLLYLSEKFDSSDLQFPNGVGSFIVKNLENNGASVNHIPSKHSLLEAPFIIKRKALSLFNIRYLKEREKILLTHEAARRSKIINALPENKVLAFGSLPIAYLDTDKDLYFFTDTTFSGIHNLYKEFSNLSESTIRTSIEVETLAFTKAKKVFVSSDWAKESAVKDYNADPNKIDVVELGANLHTTPSEYEFETILHNKEFKTLRLLFIGVDYVRKGAATSLEVAKCLAARNIQVRLDFVGCKPEFNSDTPDFVNTYGFIDKSSPQGAKLFSELIEKAHFMILPSQADTFGHVYCEANAFGVPSIACKYLGVPTVVKHGVNGGIFDLNAPIDQYVEFILEYYLNKDKYNQLSRSSYNEYKSRLNWDRSAKMILKGMFEQQY